MGIVHPVAVNMQKRLDNLLRIGVKTRLDPDTQMMQFVADGLEEWQAFHLEDCRPRYTEALRFQAGICIACGSESVTRPNSGGRKRVGGAWEPVPAPVGSFPPLWCDPCFLRGAWERFAFGVQMRKGPVATNASSKTKSDENDGLFIGPEFDDGDVPAGAEDCLFD